MANKYDLDKESPFQPGKPVSPDYFKGRAEIVNKILRYVNKAHSGDAQHYFITGKKGIGKTSLAKYVQELSSDKMIDIYISNKGNDSLSQLTTKIIEGILNKLPKSTIKEKARDVFGNYIESIEIKGTKIIFKPGPLKDDIVDNFIHYLNKLCQSLPEDKGIFLVIDDINGLSKTDDFVNWYKRMADTMAVEREYSIPIYFLLASYPETFEKLVLQDESFARIFRYDNIDYLTDVEVEEFFIDTFESENMFCEEDALKTMITFSSGLPLMMQEIGEAVYWATEGHIIKNHDALVGTINAGNLIGKRQIKPVMDKSIRSENYESILCKLGKHGIDHFKKKDFEPNLNSSEKRVFQRFLKRATDLNILESIGKYKSGEYEFSNKLYLVYFMILNLEKEQKSVGK